MIKVSTNKDAVFNWLAIVARRGREDDLIEDAGLVGSGYMAIKSERSILVIVRYERIVAELTMVIKSP